MDQDIRSRYAAAFQAITDSDLTQRTRLDEALLRLAPVLDIERAPGELGELHSRVRRLASDLSDEAAEAELAGAIFTMGWRLSGG